MTQEQRTALVSARDLHRRYGEGEAAVDALAGVTVDFLHGQFTRDHGALGFRQVDADALPRRARPADVGNGRRSTAAEITGSTTTT